MLKQTKTDNENMVFTQRKYLNNLLIVLFLIVFSACSSTKFVPEGSYLLNSLEVNVDNKQINKDELKRQVRQSENLKILGFFKFHLGLYNMSSRKKDNDWFKRIGEAPVIYQDFQTQRSLEHLQVYLKNKGYYDAIVSDTTIYHSKRKKVSLVYDIQTGEPYRIRDYNYEIEDPNLLPLIFKDTTEQVVKPGDIFDVDELNAERTRLSTQMKNNGYFAFSTDHIQYVADTALNNKEVNLTIQISDASLQENADTIRHHRKFVIRHYTFNTDFTPLQFSRAFGGAERDTIYEPPYSFIYKDKLRYKPELLENLNRMKDSTYYSLVNSERTFRSLNQLQQFKLVNLNFEPVPEFGNDSIGVLDCNMQLSPLPRQGFSVELEGTNSSGNFGVAGNLNYQHLNLFHGAEILNVTLKSAWERQQTLVSDNKLNFNTREHGLETSLTIPKFLIPFNAERFFSYQVPQTVFSGGYNYQRRPDYTRTITNVRIGYKWKSKPYRTNYLNVFDWNFVNLSNLNEDFINSIKDLYIKSSFTDHLIMAINYALVDNTQSTEKDNTYHYFKWTVESAGNILSAYCKLLGRSKYQSVDTETNETSEYYRILGNRFAQYLKTDVEFRLGYKLDKFNTIVSRAFFGAALPYGNFDVMPFEKKYFGGGANGIRAWQVRTLGPGTYKASADEYPNQSADIKLEGNIEYRFRLIGFIEGAFFLDAGNIWAINSKDNREGATFKFNQFYKEIAVGTGTGLRFDFNYFVFRFDLGVKLRDPSLPEGKRFIPGNYPLRSEHYNFNFAIGYPF
ncbi:translocation and assembly module lipoprotein TamL [Mangrovibacterium lignilyticum]|uniref:translocation and assembly module lipoprotein TamL n=1 Tax=Mangrovibacterium lignilyticum TaxID=2668052 RepID=UPI0013D215CC|nr:BamA/TamA family outer membrane protein [Mangrovibacterium lignilyticum]